MYLPGVGYTLDSYRIWNGSGEMRGMRRSELFFFFQEFVLSYFGVFWSLSFCYLGFDSSSVIVGSLAGTRVGITLGCHILLDLVMTSL